MAQPAITVRIATPNEAGVVTDLILQLLQELGGFSVTAEQMTPLANTLLATDTYHAFLAMSPDENPVGLLTLNECTALYLAGKVGWIQELYVVPEMRSKQVGHALIAAARAMATERQWQRLEVNTPDANAWPRTVAFYRHEGFAGASVHLRLAL